MSVVGDRYVLHRGGPVDLAARCPHCDKRVVIEDTYEEMIDLERLTEAMRDTFGWSRAEAEAIAEKIAGPYNRSYLRERLLLEGPFDEFGWREVTR